MITKPRRRLRAPTAETSPAGSGLCMPGLPYSTRPYAHSRRPIGTGWSASLFVRQANCNLEAEFVEYGKRAFLQSDQYDRSDLSNSSDPSVASAGFGPMPPITPGERSDPPAYARNADTQRSRLWSGCGLPSVCNPRTRRPDSANRRARNRDPNKEHPADARRRFPAPTAACAAPCRNRDNAQPWCEASTDSHRPTRVFADRPRNSATLRSRGRHTLPISGPIDPGARVRSGPFRHC